MAQDRLYLLEQSENQNKVEGWVYGDAELLEFYGITHLEPVNIDSSKEVEALRDKLRSLCSNVNKIHYKKNKTAEKTIRIYFDDSQDLNNTVKKY